jgi:hypothetical protein
MARMANTGGGLKQWFSQNQGTGWVDCKTGKPCGRKKGEKRAAAKKKTGPARISWNRQTKKAASRRA